MIHKILKLSRKVFLPFIVLCISVFVFSSVPMKVNYQSVLKEKGQLVTGTRKMKFEIYNTQTGGTAVWSSGDVNIEVKNGVFRYTLDFTNSNIDFANGPYYLQVTIEGTPLEPREEIVSTIYAINSKIAEQAKTAEKVKWSDIENIPPDFADGVDNDTAGGSIGADSIGSYHIIDSTITSADIKDSAITTSKIADGAVIDVKIQSISPTKISAGDLPSNVYATAIKKGDYLNDVKVSSAIYADVAGSLAGSVPGDNLGNHTATQELNMNGKSIINVSSISVSDAIGIGDSFVIDGVEAKIGDLSGNQMGNYFGIEFDSEGKFYFLDGNVGIGTINPSYKLDVYGLIRSTAGFICPDGTILTSTSTLGGMGGDNLGNHIATQNLDMDDFGIVNISSITNINKQFFIQTVDEDLILQGWNESIKLTDLQIEYNSKYHLFKTNNNNRVLITEEGNVGIGTIFPEATLHVVGTSTFTAQAGFSGNIITISTGTTVLWRFDTSDSNAYALGAWQGGGADYAEWFEKDDGEKILPGDLVGLNLSTGKARKYKEGDVLIGVCSTNPGFVGNSDINRSDEELKQNYVLVGLVGQLEVNKTQVVINNREVKTLDGKLVGYMLSNGKVLIKM